MELKIFVPSEGRRIVIFVRGLLLFFYLMYTLYPCVSSLVHLLISQCRVIVVVFFFVLLSFLTVIRKK